MNERAKRRLLPLLLTITFAVVLAICGVSVLSVDHIQTTSAVKAEAAVGASGGDGMEETVGTSATYNFSTVTTKNSAGQRYVDLSYTGSGYHTVTLQKGCSYTFQVWGAQGGNSRQYSAYTSINYGGKGGYAVGTTGKLAANMTVYVYVGGQGATGGGTVAGGYNGGGTGYHYNGSWGAGGGGATDIRLTAGTWNADASLKSRVIVAGGGGGASINNYNTSNVGGAGGGATGQSANWYSGGMGASGGPGGGTQTGIGATPNQNGGQSTTPGFGYGGNGPAYNGNSHSESGGGGGWYGGWGGNASYSGAGGSAYVLTSSSSKPSGYTGYNANLGYLSGTNMIIGTSAVPVTTINSTATETGHSGNGFARITQLNAVPTQSTVPTFANCNRKAGITVNLNTANGGSYNLNGSDADTNEIPRIKTAGIYLSASTASPATAYLNYSMSVNGTSITNLYPKQYWTGTKPFYVNVSDYNTSTGDLPGADVWFSFNMSVNVGSTSVKPDGLAVAANGSGVNKIGAASQRTPLTKEKYNVGNSTTTVATAAQSRQAGNAIYNPLGTGRPTLWLADALSSDKETVIDVNDLYDRIAGPGASAETSTALETLVFDNSNANTIVFGTNRYSSQSSNAASAESISLTPGATNSSYFSTASLSETFTVGSAARKGAKKIALSAIAGRSAGANYYYVTIRVYKVCSISGTDISWFDLDIIYRVDNERAKIVANPATISLLSGATATAVKLSSFVNDADGNPLRIVDVVVPTNEFILSDKYGNVLAAPVNYNQVSGVKAGDKLACATEGDAYYNTVKKTAQYPGASTGWSDTYAYYAIGTGYDASFIPPNENKKLKGSAEGGAYVGVYVNPARDTLYLYGNKATKYMYKDKDPQTDMGSRHGHFYLMVRIEDAGEIEDEGIWAPIAVQVTSAAPQSAGNPYVSGAVGTTVYMTPLGLQTATGGNYNAIGVTQDNQDKVSEWSTATPIAYDRDNYSYADNTQDRSVNGTQLPYTKENPTLAQREMVFLSNKELSLNISGVYDDNRNSILFDTLDHYYGSDDDTAAVTDYRYGYKEFFSVAEVDLYASSSILRGLTDCEISKLLTDKVIRMSTNGQLVIFKGLAITLKKSTLENYLSFYVNVTDTHGVSAAIRVSVQVTAGSITLQNNARTRSTADGGNLNPRVSSGYPDGSSTGSVSHSADSRTYNATYYFHMRRGEVLRISPYDLIYSVDTYNLNYGKDALTDKTWADDSGNFNTVPTYRTDKNYSAEYAAAHKKALAGINKNIAVLASSTASGTATPTPNFKFRAFSIANTNPTLGTAGSFISVNARAETADYMQHFEIIADKKTPANGYAAFTYTITGTQPGEAGVSVEIRVVIDNTVPQLHEINEIPDVFYLSSAVRFGNSSTEGNDVWTDNAEAGYSYFTLAEGTFNVREFLASDLFSDIDGESVYFLYTLSVGTKNTKGEFIAFSDEENIFVKALIGSGSNQRYGSSCLILEGLSSTQGIPGGLWIGVTVSDGNGENTTYYLQVEVLNAAPIIEDYTGANEMSYEPVSATDMESSYVWKITAETTNSVVARMLPIANAQNGSYTYPSTHIVKEDYSDGTTTGGFASVIKPIYIAANEKSMEAYKAKINERWDSLEANHSGKYNYAASQVRYIAKDTDAGQGLVLHSNGGNSRIQGVSLGAMGPYSAVAVNGFYLGSYDLQWYLDRNVIQLVFFERDASGNLAWIDPTLTDAAAKTNLATDWVIAINFTNQSIGEALRMTVRLRDSAGKVFVKEVNDPAYGNGMTIGAGGYAYGSQKGYYGVRTVSSTSGVFSATTAVGNLDGENPGEVSVRDFSFAVKMSSAGIYNNLTKWATGDTAQLGNGTTVSLNNVWVGGDTDSGEVKYFHNDGLGATFVTGNDDLFRYGTIKVPDSGAISVPISYFTWAQDNVSSDSRVGQTTAASFDIDEIAAPGTIFTKVTSAITISDGYNEWSGESRSGEKNGLNDNPYVTVRYASWTALDSAGDGSGNRNPYGESTDVNNRGKASSGYLYGQQRISTANGQLIPVVDTNHSNQYFLEDQFGLTFSKKYMRSVGNLTLKIKFTLWKKNTQTGRWVNQGDEYDVEVVAMLSVANTAIKIQNSDGAANNEFPGITTSAEKGNYNIVLTNANSSTATSSGTTIKNIFSAANTNEDYVQSRAADQMYSKAASMIRGIHYMEDMYFLAHSLKGDFSASEAEYISKTLESRSQLVSDGFSRVTGTYFGFGSGDIISADGKQVLAAGKIDEKLSSGEWTPNPHYNDYFDVTLSNTDSTNLVIIPKNITTFYWQEVVNENPSMSLTDLRQAITEAAADRGLVIPDGGIKTNNGVITSVDDMYYRLKLLVYDRLTVGSSYNTTSFGDSSYDLITLDISITNSAPTVRTYNGYTEKDLGGNRKYPTRDVTLAKNDISSGTPITYIFSDADMVVSNDGTSFFSESNILGSDDEVRKHTGDYPRPASGTDDLVSYEFLPLSADGGVTNEWNAQNPNGGIACEIVGGSSVVISVKNRIKGFDSNTAAAYVKITLTDRFGESASVVFRVFIGNNTPYLTTEANSTRSITMKSGEYFTLLATHWGDDTYGFSSGVGLSTVLTEHENNTYYGTYEYTTNNTAATNPASAAFASVYPGVQRWSYENGPMKSGSSVQNKWGDFDKKTAQGYAIGDSPRPASLEENNLGYMAIANDDAPWTLRIMSTTFSSNYMSNGSAMLSYTLLNPVLYEGVTDKTENFNPNNPFSQGTYGHTAVMFRANGACKDVEVKVTIWDANSGDPKAQSVVYSFKITVETTKPELIENNSELGESFYRANPDLKGTTTATTRLYYLPGDDEYVLKMYAGEKFTLRMSDFATDVDVGDRERLWLLQQSGNNRFAINEKNAYVDVTSHFSLSSEPIARPTYFEVTATNFNNEVKLGDNPYDTVYFSIADPSANLEESGYKDNYCLDVTLRIYVYPNEVTAAGTTSKRIDISSVAEYVESGESYAIPLVSMPGGDGLVYDSDVESNLTRYNVKIYSLVYEDGDVLKSYSLGQFSDMLGSETGAADRVIATYTVDPARGLSVTPITEYLNNPAAKIVRKYIESVNFSLSGATMYVVPAKATNDVRLIASGATANKGFYLYATVQKYVSRPGANEDYGPNYNKLPNDDTVKRRYAAYSAGGSMQTTVKNSAPYAVGATVYNDGIRGDSLPYNTVVGGRGSKFYDFYLYNDVSESDEALFADYDGDKLTYVSGKLEYKRIFTYDGDNEILLNNYPQAKEKAQAALLFRQEELTYSIANSDEEYKFNGIYVEIVKKIDLQDYRDKTIYVEVTVVATDGNNENVGEATIIIGVRNTAPELNSEAVVAQKNSLYVSETAQNSYTKTASGDASLTLTLSRDDSDKYITKNEGGRLRVNLSDFVSDKDYNDKDLAQNNESFRFVQAVNAGVGIDLEGISGDNMKYMWLSDKSTEAKYVSTPEEAPSTADFLIRVTQTDNSIIEFRAMSYNRGAKAQVFLKVSDSSGETTGTLTITLIIGNSAPIDMTRTPDADGKYVSNSIVLSGGTNESSSAADEELNKEIFKAKEYSIFTYVYDRNPGDNGTKVTSVPEEAKTYLRITEVSYGDITFDPSSVHTDYVGSSAGLAGDTGEASDKSASLVSFMLLSGQQRFSITPLPKLYGKQPITLTVTDAGNSNEIGSEVIRIEIEIQITKNPRQQDTNVFKVYYRRTMEVTAKDVFDRTDNPADPDNNIDESEGYTIIGVAIDNPEHESYARVAHLEGSSIWSIEGRMQTVKTIGEIPATAEVKVGAQVQTYKVPFKIVVDENKQPDFKYNDDNKLFSDGITYFSRTMFDDDGMWTVPISYFLYDREGDTMTLVSAKSKKSTLIDVIPDTNTGELTFHFKSRGDTEITMRVADAVATYNYTFQIGNKDLPAPNFFMGAIAKIQGNPLMFILIAAAVLLFIIILIAIIAVARKKKKMREEIEALLVSEMELEEQMLKLASGPSPTYYQSYGYLPPTQGGAAQPGFMLGTGQAPNPNAAIGLNPGAPQNGGAQTPPTGGFSDDDL